MKKTGPHCSLPTPSSSTMNPRLNQAQLREISSHLENKNLHLLYKATVHGFTTAAFHQCCDNQGATVTVGYCSTTGQIYGAYTSKNFSNNCFIIGVAYMEDDMAFIFTFPGNGQNLVRCDLKLGCAQYAVQNKHNHGPYFGEDLIFLPNGQPYVDWHPGSYYNNSTRVASAKRVLCNNQIRISECEVYQVQVKPVTLTSTEKPWRNVLWKDENKKQLMAGIQSYKSIISSVTQVRVLLIGPVGAGKSSFFNSINSIFRGHVTSQAIAGNSGTSLTTQYRTYHVKAGRDGKPLPIILCDTMGLEESTGAGLNVDDITSILKGHIIDRYQFNSAVPLQAEHQGYNMTPGVQDKIHCVCYAIDASKVSIMPTKLEEKLTAIRRKVNLMGIPQLVLLTKVDEACSTVAQDLKNVYHSPYIRTMAQEVSQRVGVPLSCVLPVKNYSEELELDQCCDILLLTAVNQMLRFADNYFDDISDQFSQIRGSAAQGTNRGGAPNTGRVPQF